MNNEFIRKSTTYYSLNSVEGSHTPYAVMGVIIDGCTVDGIELSVFVSLSVAAALSCFLAFLKKLYAAGWITDTSNAAGRP
jgi:hypothetical protein